ncbi:versican core protein-like isoform X2 [Mytilus edulis]|uniref:versican core protein-like isoform X2 n=1 Tax=Mytilus edulis TaxID=6550 RepID=UPI0039EE31A3
MKVYKTMLWISIAIFIIPQIRCSDRFSYWSRNEHLTNYLSTRNEIYTLNSSSKLMCVNECTKTANCVSVFYIEKSCRLNNVYFTGKAELVHKPGSEYIASVTACSSNPCLNGGTCSPSESGSSFTCDCLSGSKDNLCKADND